jgi:beta-N-acetylhexosaminidase
MPGHLLVPALDADAPATVSRAIITNLLRGELGFDGVVVTDALDMGGIGGPAEIPANVVRALAAGADLCCLGPDNDEALVEACIDAVVAAVAAGTLAVERVADAAARVASLRATMRVAADTGDLAPASGACVGEGRRNDGAPRDQLPDRDTAIAALAAVGAEAARRSLLVDGAVPDPVRGAHVVELDRPANIAAGTVPWSVAAALAGLDPTMTAARLAEGDEAAVTAALTAAAGRPLVVVVRDPQRRPAQAAAVHTLLAARPDAVVVDVGWPATAPLGGEDGAPAAGVRITTFGASRASGEAVARLLAGIPAPEAGPPAGPTDPTSGRISRG